MTWEASQSSTLTSLFFYTASSMKECVQPGTSALSPWASLSGALNELVTRCRAANLVNGQSVLSISEASGYATFTSEVPYTMPNLC